MAKQTVFVTGAAGFLGSHLAEALIGDGHRVLGCDNLIGGDLDNVPREVEFFEHDCSDLWRMREAMRHVDLVFHTAATAYEGLSVFSPALIARNVYGATVSVLSAAISNGVRRFVFCSSMARYGQNDVPFREDMAPRPQDPYGIAKMAAELTIANLCATHRMEYSIVVPHNIIGPRQKYDDPYRNVASIMINLMLQGRPPVIYGDGTQRRCFSYIDDVLDPLLKMGFAQNVVGETINIGPDEEFVTIRDLAALLAELLGIPLAPIYQPSRPQEVQLANCSADKARRLLGYAPRVLLRQALERTIQWIRAKGPRPFRYHIDLEIENALTPRTWAERLL